MADSTRLHPKTFTCPIGLTRPARRYSRLLAGLRQASSASVASLGRCAAPWLISMSSPFGLLARQLSPADERVDGRPERACAATYADCLSGFRLIEAKGAAELAGRPARRQYRSITRLERAPNRWRWLQVRCSYQMAMRSAFINLCSLLSSAGTVQAALITATRTYARSHINSTSRDHESHHH